jgi:hypothetical protein
MQASGRRERDLRETDQWRYAAAVVILWGIILAIAFV